MKRVSAVWWTTGLVGDDELLAVSLLLTLLHIFFYRWCQDQSQQKLPRTQDCYVLTAC